MKMPIIIIIIIIIYNYYWIMYRKQLQSLYKVRARQRNVVNSKNRLILYEQLVVTFSIKSSHRSTKQHKGRVQKVNAYVTANCCISQRTRAKRQGTAECERFHLMRSSLR